MNFLVLPPLPYLNLFSLFCGKLRLEGLVYILEHWNHLFLEDMVQPLGSSGSDAFLRVRILRFRCEMTLRAYLNI